MWCGKTVATPPTYIFLIEKTPKDYCKPHVWAFVYTDIISLMWAIAVNWPLLLHSFVNIFLKLFNLVSTAASWGSEFRRLLMHHSMHLLQSHHSVCACKLCAIPYTWSVFCERIMSCKEHSNHPFALHITTVLSLERHRLQTSTHTQKIFNWGPLVFTYRLVALIS